MSGVELHLIVACRQLPGNVTEISITNPVDTYHNEKQHLDVCTSYFYPLGSISREKLVTIFMGDSLPTLGKVIPLRPHDVKELRRNGGRLFLAEHKYLQSNHSTLYKVGTFFVYGA